MAATNKPFGLMPVHTRSGSEWNDRVTLYYIPSNDNAAMYVGDPVKSAATADTSGVPAVAIAAGTDTLRGVMVGALLAAPNQASIQGTLLDNTVTNVPATKARAYYVLVADDVDLVFNIQDDGVTTANLVAASANKNFSLTIAAPSNAVQRSATVMLSSSLATTNTLNMKAFGLAQLPNNVFGAYGIWRCMINVHEFHGSSTAV